MTTGARNDEKLSSRGASAVIPGCLSCHPGVPQLSSRAWKVVIPGLTRDPVPRHDWIADQVRNDNSGQQ